MITLENITFSYNDLPVIKDLSLDVEKGGWLGIIGPNGAGKTTLIRLMSGLLTKGAGTITIDGKEISAYSRREMAKLIAVVPQVSQFAFSFSALEIVLMGRYPHIKRFGLETASDIKIAREAMEATDTWQFRDRSIDELSGGERQRVLIARALAEEPKILLLDEPTTFLDIRHQLDVMEILFNLNQREGITIVAAIHDINLAISYCKKIALVYDGRIFKEGDPISVITYANLKSAFGAEIFVGINEFTQKPYYIPMKR